MKICLTGGIACGKSLLSRFLNELGVDTLDADDIVHELIPADERRRLAAVVFSDPSARRELESRIHPLVKDRLRRYLSEPTDKIRMAVVPLLFEVHWDTEFDIICCVKSSRSMQIERMMKTRGYSREEAEGRLSAQMDVEEKAARSHYVIENDGTAEDLKRKAEEFVSWLKSSTYSPRRQNSSAP